jgi:Chaperone of endosialidase
LRRSFAENASGQPATPRGYPNFTTGAGEHALQALTLGVGNTAIGTFSLFSVTTGNFNTAVGAAALLFNTTGTENTANGTAALENNTIGTGNTANGVDALFNNTTGIDNTAIGDEALAENTTGSANTALGVGAGVSVITARNVMCIGIGGADVNNTTWIGNVYSITTQNAMTAPVIVSADGQLGTVASSERFKKEIANMGEASDAILSLRPVTFHYKTDIKGTPQFGLIAEEVAKVNPALVLPDKEGKPYTVRYDAVNAMLLDEFLKEHRKNEERQGTIGQLKSNAAKQEATISELKKDMGVLIAQLKQQAAQIQRVSARIEMNHRPPQMIVNNH